MTFDKTTLPIESINIILQNWLENDVSCRSIQRLHGGMINSVLELGFDQPPYEAVIKVSGDASNSFKREAHTLRYLKEKTKFPVPKAYDCRDAGELIEQSFLLIERLPGVNLGQAQMTASQRQDVDFQLADILTELHGHQRDLYGDIDGSETHENWIDIIEPRLRENFEDTKDRLTQKSLSIIPNLLDEIPKNFASQGKPTLIHGDIWATNVMVDQNDGRWNVTGFVDPASFYADVEFELAYLEVFGTVTDSFFERYCEARPLRKGYEIRRLYYWLNTMMLHVWLFGDKHYVMRTERIAEQIKGMI